MLMLDIAVVNTAVPSTGMHHATLIAAAVAAAGAVSSAWLIDRNLRPKHRDASGQNALAAEVEREPALV
jgi:hypothetical protein